MKTLNEIEKEFDDWFKGVDYDCMIGLEEIKQFYRQKFEEVLKEVKPKSLIDKTTCDMADETCAGAGYKRELEQNISLFLGKEGGK